MDPDHSSAYRSSIKVHPAAPMSYVVFHINMAFSAIEEDERPTVIERCYWPVLRLAQHFPIGVEATGYTLSRIAEIDPNWVAELRKLVAEQKVEFVGSGAVQLIGPLVAPEVTQKNLELGHIDYDRMVGTRPKLALVNEQAYAPGLLPLYKEAGYEAVMLDWAEAASHHPEWPSDLSGKPQTIHGAGVEMPVVWSDAISFQKFQRYAHGELSAEEYFEFLSLQQEKGARAIPLYTSDAEVFDYRPGRFQSEAGLGSAVEYERIHLLLTAMQKSGVVNFVLPSEVLKLRDKPQEALKVESAAAPVTVKKQRKYNLLRWGLTGRSDMRLNTYCWRKLEQLQQSNDVSEEDWRSLLHIWASDFRTHITQNRWEKLQESLALLPPSRTDHAPRQKAGPEMCQVEEQGRNLVIQTESGHLVLNCYRGMAIQAFGFGRYEPAVAGAPAENSLIGTLAHGFFDDIEFGADFYSGHMVFEPADAGKISDLSRCTPEHSFDDQTGELALNAVIATGMGSVKKFILLNVQDHTVTVEYELPEELRLWGSLRLGHAMLNPKAFDKKSLYFASHNGGNDLEYHPLFRNGELVTIDHGRPVNKLVSATTALGMTGSELIIGDKSKRVILTMARTDAAGLGMVACQPVKESFFARALISVRETDETARKEPDLLAPAIRTVRKRYKIALQKS